MKIGILTPHYALNAGAALQAWALQTYLQKNGYEAKVVNYGKIGWSFKYSINCTNLRHFVGSFYRGFKTFFLSFGIESYRRRLFRDFLYPVMRVDRPSRKEETIIALLSCGEAPEEFDVADSPRKSLEEVFVHE